MDTGFVTIGERTWEVYIADSFDERMSGLGGWSSLSPNIGMLFVMGYEAPIQVTTVPMLFDLDIVFINSDLEVTDVSRNIAPDNIIQGQGSYFLEVNADEAQDVSVGDTVLMSLEHSTDLMSNVMVGMIAVLVAVVFVKAAGKLAR